MKTKTITLEELNKLSAPNINGVIYPPPFVYLDKFIDKGNTNFTVSNEIALNDAGTNYNSYLRFAGKTQFNLLDGMKYEVGCIVALDLGTPLIKLYAGTKVSVCNNLCGNGTIALRFNPSDNYKDIIENLFNSLDSKIRNQIDYINYLKNIILSEEQIKSLCYNLLIEPKVYGSTTIVKGIKLLNDNTNNLYYGVNNFWDIHNALNHNINEESEHDIMLPEKVNALMSKSCDILNVVKYDNFVNSAQTSTVEVVNDTVEIVKPKKSKKGK